MGLDNDKATNAYLFSLSAVHYMADSYGMYRIRSVLDELATGATISTAVSNGEKMPYEEFERGWKRSLE
jgi:hypothetical protein